ncbi:MAG TPA: hypothetical protein VGC41_16015, partial [Kofleriaceae bacterium]
SWGELSASDVVPAQLPRVGAGQATLVLARVKQVKAANVRARGDLVALTSFTASTPPQGATSQHGVLARRWARIRLDDLINAGHPRAVIGHALQYGLVSPYTAMVAIGDEVIVDGGVKHTRGVPVALPAGMQWQPVEHETTLSIDQTKTKSGTVDKSDPDEVADYKKHQGKKSEDEPRKNAKKPAPPVSPPTTTATTSGGKPQGGESSDAEEKPERDGDDDEDAPRRKEVAEPSVVESAETISLSGATGYDVVEGGPFLHLDLGVGVGVSRVNSDTNAEAIVRLDAAIAVGRMLLGVEGSLWIGDLVEGTVNLQLTRPITYRTHVGIGAGMHLGNDVGPAVDLELRHAVTRRLWIYLRYDGALLYRDHTHDGQNTGSLGVELHF